MTKVCLSRQTSVCRDKDGFVTTKHVFCHDKIMLIATKVLSRQNTLVATNIIWSKQKFCRDKHTFVATKYVFCPDKPMFVATNTCLSRQNFCHDKKDTHGSFRQSYGMVGWRGWRWGRGYSIVRWMIDAGLNVLRCRAEILGTIPVWWINELSIYIGARTQR